MDTVALAGLSVLVKGQKKNIIFPRNPDTDASKICKADAKLQGLSLAGSGCMEKQARGERKPVLIVHSEGLHRQETDVKQNLTQKYPTSQPQPEAWR